MTSGNIAPPLLLLPLLLPSTVVEVGGSSVGHAMARCQLAVNALKHSDSRYGGGVILRVLGGRVDPDRDKKSRLSVIVKTGGRTLLVIVCEEVTVVSFEVSLIVYAQASTSVVVTGGGVSTVVVVVRLQPPSSDHATSSEVV